MFSHHIDCLLIFEHIPDTIARDDEKLALRGGGGGGELLC